MLVNKVFKIPEKALIVLPDFIGDTVLLIPVLRNLRYNFNENTSIDLIGNKNVINLLETLPFFDNFYLNKVTNKLSFLKKQKYDTIFLFNFQLSWTIFSCQAKVSQRISFNLERIGFKSLPLWRNLITHFINSTPINDKKPQKEVYLNVLKDLNLKIFDEYIDVKLTNKDLDKAKELLENIPKPRISIHVTAGSPGKQWDIKNWIIILKYLKNKYNGGFISMGAESEKNIYDYLADQSGIKLNNLCGKTTIRETLALYQDLDLMITIDTASAHLAALANTKNIIIIYGPTNESQWNPYTLSSNIKQVYLNLPCRPCLTRFCRHKNCLRLLKPSEIINITDKIPMF
ncbi:MAG: glycosyltransferase family 9 protein [bacterium]